jgi:hypothetical protein
MKYATPFVYIEYADMGKPNYIIDGHKYIGEGRYKDFYFVTTENAFIGNPEIGLIPPSPYTGNTPLPKNRIPLVKQILLEILLWKHKKVKETAQ